MSQLLDLVYEAAVEPQRWPAVLDASTRWLGAKRALLLTPGVSLGDEGLFSSHGVSAEEIAVWSSRFVGQDFWMARAIERGFAFEGSIFRAGDLSTRRELLASGYFREREHLTRMDIGWLMTAVILAPKAGSMPMVALPSYRGLEDESGFDEQARGWLALLLPHLSRSLSVMMRLRQAEIRAASSAAALAP